MNADFPACTLLGEEVDYGRDQDSHGDVVGLTREGTVLRVRKDAGERAHTTAQPWIVAIPLDKAMFCGDDSFIAADLAHVADAGVRAFLAAYGQHTP